jgi:carboxymethylenebutenolidase
MHEYEVEIATDDGVMDTFVCHPDEGGPHPAIIMYMDAPGIREELRDMARRIATVGYCVILPNLYYRTGVEGKYGFDLSAIRSDSKQLQNMFDIMNATTNERVVADTKHMLEFIEGEPHAAPGQVGCVGYCMSGRIVMSVAASYPESFAAIASYYGVGIMTEENNSPHLMAHRITGEVYLAFAQTDVYVPEPLLEAIPAALDQVGVNYRMEIYPGTEHGFAFPNRPAYNKAAAERHWQRLLALFERNLKKD